MSRRPAPSKGDRHENRNAIWNSGHRSVEERPVPEVRPGQRRCPVCRNSVGLTTRGYLRSHVDLFGVLCANKSTGEPIALDEIPPVVLPPAPPEPREPRRNTAERIAAPREASRLDAGSECRECGKWLPGERSLCGRCYALGGRR